MRKFKSIQNLLSRNSTKKIRPAHLSDCFHPWTWLYVNIDADARPCYWAPKPVGNLARDGLQSVWNGETMQALRKHILRGKVHEVCAGSRCPFLNPALSEQPARLANSLSSSFIRLFDERDYLESNPDVASVVNNGELSCGLEHFLDNGQREGRPHKLNSRKRPVTAFNKWERSIEEYCRGNLEIKTWPTTLTIDVTTKCNLKCVMCPHATDNNFRKEHLEPSVIDQLSPIFEDNTRIQLAGVGEPLLAPAAWRVFEKTAKKTRIYVRLNTNGLFLTPDKIDQILHSSVAEISFSLDSCCRETYRKIRGVDRFERVIANVQSVVQRRKELNLAKPDILVNVTLMRENIEELTGIVAMASSLGADRVMAYHLRSLPPAEQDWSVNNGHWNFDYEKQKLDHYPELSDRIVKQATILAGELGIRFVAGFGGDHLLFSENRGQLHSSI